MPDGTIQGPTIDPDRAVGSTSLRDQLRRLFAKVKLPSSPALATKILSLASNPDASVDDFASMIQIDAALSARLLKMSNAAHLGQRTPVTNIPKAVRVLGFERVRTTALGFQLVGHVKRLGGCPFDMEVYWQHSLLRGCLAREIAKRVVPTLHEEAFLVGLLEDVGILLLVQLLGQPYADLYSQFGMAPATFFAKEKESAGHHHVDASEAMAAEWGLPESIAIPISRHHTPTILTERSSDLDRLCAISYLVGSTPFAKNQPADPVAEPLQLYAREQLGLSAADIQPCFAQSAAAYQQLGELLGESLPENLDVTELLSDANRQLTIAAGEAEEKITHVIAERDEVKSQQNQLKSALGEYRDRASRDPLTGVLNRGALTEAVAAFMTQSAELTAIFLDIDNFKKLNDCHGHQTGDVVLKAVTLAISKLVANAGCVGRYGGEEFVLVIPGLSAAEAEARGQRVVEVVREIDPRALKLEKPVTCSVGAVWGLPRKFRTVAELFAQADACMYRAKRSGKDRCCYEASPPDGKGESPRAPAIGAARTVSHLQEVAMRLNQRSPTPFTDLRKQQRQELVTPCHLALITDALSVHAETAYIRNISKDGFGLVAARMLRRGQPVEILMQLQDQTAAYLAGVVAYCRHIEGEVHETGVQLFAHGKEPIFSSNPRTAVKDLPWLAEALGQSRDSAALANT